MAQLPTADHGLLGLERAMRVRENELNTGASSLRRERAGSNGSPETLTRSCPNWRCPWPKLDLKAVNQTVARSALSAMALKNGSGQRIAAERSVTAV
jgi:hypothetical protein